MQMVYKDRCRDTKKIIAVTYTTEAAAKIKPGNNSGLYKIQTHDLCNTGAAVLPLELNKPTGSGQLPSVEMSANGHPWIKCLQWDLVAYRNDSCKQRFQSGSWQGSCLGEL